ncbi:MAG TPA: 4Fe-4S dicluster domain-containing protein [Desulfurococcales archaeon]|nr:4Fe-4S dicluster domain-containing protein [Desulfurococcales archaeon]
MATESKYIRIDHEKCIGCGVCTTTCPTQALSLNPENKAVVDPDKCTGCHSCTGVCPSGAIEKKE